MRKYKASSQYIKSVSNGISFGNFDIWKTEKEAHINQPNEGGGVGEWGGWKGCSEYYTPPNKQGVTYQKTFLLTKYG